MSIMETHVAIVGVVKFNDRILILQRHPNKQYSPNLWEFVGGFLKEGEATEECVIREVKEETGLDGTLVKRGTSFESTDPWSHWIVVPHLVSVPSDRVQLSEEHTGYQWILPSELGKFDTVVNAKKDLEAAGVV